MKSALFAAPIALLSVTPLHAQAAATPEQQPVQQPAPIAPAPTPPLATQVVLAAPAQEQVLRVGTPIPMTFAEEVTTKGKKAKVGQRVRLTVTEDVRVDGKVVIPAGTPGMGELTEVRNKGMWGKSGKINGRVLYLRAGDRQIRLSGAFDDKGIAGTAGVIGAAVVLPLVGFFVTGTSATLELGAPVNAFIDEDVALTFVETAPAPMTVAVDSASDTAATAPAPLTASAPVPETGAPAAPDE